MKLLAASLMALLVLAANAAHADGCSQQNIARAAAQLLRAQHDLQAVPIGDGLETDVPAAGRRAIAKMKDRIAAYVAAAMLCQRADARVRDVQQTLAGAAEKTSTKAPIRYGTDLTFEVRIAPGLTSVVASFGIECGEDAMLMIFERRGDAWVEVLRSQSGPYKTVGGGWWTFDYAISPRDASGKWFVATKNVAPWCSSTWSEIRYAVLRPGAEPAAPRRIFGRSDSIWWGSDRYGDLKVGAHDFDLRFRAESIDDGVHNREWIRHYAVDGDRVRRIPPVAEFPRDFADEWLASSWSEAGQWTLPASAARLRSVHDTLHGIRFLEYVSEHACSGGPDRFQVAVEPTDPKAGSADYYFQIAGRVDYRMLDVTRAPSPACNQPDRIDPPVQQ